MVEGEKLALQLEGLDERSLEAIMALARAAAKLKESGMLDMLVTIAEKYEELLVYSASDRRVYHAIALLEALLTGLKNVDPWKAKPAVETLTSCMVSALDPEEMKKAEPVKGLMSLLKALRDPYVAKGLGVLIAIARSLGKCISGETRE